MNNSSREFFLSYILENKVADALKINHHRLQLLGIEFPTHVNEAGSIVLVNGIELDALTSRRLTYEIWSLDHLNSSLIKTSYAQHEGVQQLRKKSIELLIRVLAELKNSTTINEIVSLVESIEEERRTIKNELFKLTNLVIEYTLSA